MPADHTPELGSVNGPLSFERIDCAALRTNGGIVISVPRPGRHGDVIKYMISIGYTPEDIAESIQGFTTTQMRFVGRSVAWLIACDAQQLKPYETIVGRPAYNLFSEDMW